MPEICRFYGIIIFMNYNDHDPSHFHASVTFLKLELLCHEHFACICPGKGLGSIPVVAFDVEHDLIDQFLL